MDTMKCIANDANVRTYNVHKKYELSCLDWAGFEPQIFGLPVCSTYCAIEVP
jgi:hypothetical protein